MIFINVIAQLKPLLMKFSNCVANKPHKLLLSQIILTHTIITNVFTLDFR